jgi:type IV pilus assembly protein PilB
MGVEPYLVASAVDCILAQRLARRLCTSCRIPVRVAGSVVGAPERDEVEIYEPGGCHRCRETGYRGRLGLFEVMIVTDEIRALIVAHAPAVKLAKLAVEQGMTTLLDDGLEKVRTGQTTLAEISRVMG